MLLPGFGDSYVSARIRLVFAFILSFALVSAVPELPKLPVQATVTLVLLFHEIAIGLMIGGVIKILTSAVFTSGIIIAAQSSLGQATLFDPSQQTQGAVFGTFMQMLGIVMIFEMNFHHMMITGMIDSYDLFKPDSPLNFGDFSNLAVKSMSKAWMIGVQMAAPLIVVGMLLNVSAGILARLMPAFQVFFVMLPVQILLAFFVFMVTLSSVMMVYLQFLDQSLLDMFPRK